LDSERDTRHTGVEVPVKVFVLVWLSQRADQDDGCDREEDDDHGIQS
jgi:hypothetical protein